MHYYFVNLIIFIYVYIQCDVQIVCRVLPRYPNFAFIIITEDRVYIFFYNNYKCEIEISQKNATKNKQHVENQQCNELLSMYRYQNIVEEKIKIKLIKLKLN